MEPQHLDAQVAVSSQPEIVTVGRSAVEAANWLEIGLTAICFVIVFVAVSRRTSRIAVLLLVGLGFLVLKHVLFLLIFWLQPQVPWPGPLAGYAGSVGWLFVVLYCLGLLFARRTEKG